MRQLQDWVCSYFEYESAKNKFALVMRQDRNKRLVLNAPIWDGISPKILPPKVVLFVRKILAFNSFRLLQSLRIQAVNDATNSKKIEVFLISVSDTIALLVVY